MDAKQRRALVERVIRAIADEAEEAARAKWRATPHRWQMDVSAEGVAYGIYPVILSRGGEFLMGAKSPFGPVMSTALDPENPFREYHADELAAEGWTVTCPPVPGRATPEVE